MLLDDDVVAYGQAEASTLSRWLGREEGVEHLLPDLVRNSDAVVANPDLYPVAKVFGRRREGDWLAQFGIKPHHTNTAIGQFTVEAEDQRTGKPVNRRVAVIAISVWYEEPPKQGE
jgi:hypothetical protein